MTRGWGGALRRSYAQDEPGGGRMRKRRRALAVVGALALTASSLSATTLFAQPAQAAAGDPFPAADPLVFVAQGIPTTLYQAVTDASGTVSFEAEGPAAPLTYNAISYNTADNYLYGIAAADGGGIPLGSLIRIGQEGQITRVGTNTFGSNHVGTFGPNNHLYVMGATTTMSVVNVATGALVRTLTLSQLAHAADFAYADGFFWGLTTRNSTATAPSIVRVNPSTGAVAFFNAPVALEDSSAGAAWTFGNGNLGFSSNGTGVVSQISVTNPASAAPTFALVAQSPGPASGNNDGAASPGLPTDLSIVKTGPAATVPAGGTATYTLTVTNNGPGNSSGFVVNDAVPAPLTNVATDSDACTVTGNDVRCIGGRTLAGESVTFRITAEVPANVTASVANSASVTPNEDDPTPGNNTSTTTSDPASLSIVKHAGTPVDVNGNGLVDAGDTIRYTFDVTNTGEAALTGVRVDDPKVGAVLCPTTTLDAGDAITCAAENVYVITAADVENGSVDNSATATATTPDGVEFTSPPSTTSTPTTAPAPGISVVKSADPSDEQSFTAGQEIVYSFVVSNTGNVPLNDVTVNEGAFTGTGELSPVVCPDTSLEVTEQMVCSATYTLTQEDVDAGSVSNSATADGTPTGSETPVPSDPSEFTIPTPADPGLAVLKSANTGAIVAAGQEITYSFRVTNTGNVTMSDIVVNETAFTGSGELSAVECPVTSLVPGQFTTCTATYTVSQADIDAGGVLSNTATAGGSTPGGGPLESDPSTHEVPVTQQSGLTVVKSSDAEEAEAGQEITYSFLVTNTGNVTITDPSVTDTEFSGSGELSPVTCPTGPLAPGDDVTCTATYTVTQEDVDAGGITNVATATGSVPDGSDPIEPTPSNQVTVGTDPNPLLEVTKTSDAEEITEEGQVVTYSFLVRNAGNVTIEDPVVNDDGFTGSGELSEVVCPAEPTVLAPGDEITCTATYRVLAADLQAGGELSNTATASGSTPGGDPITSVPSTVTVDLEAPDAPGTPAPPADPVEPGDTPPGSPAPGGDLPLTGSGLLAPALGLAALLLALGGSALVLRRRGQRNTVGA